MSVGILCIYVFKNKNKTYWYQSINLTQWDENLGYFLLGFQIHVRDNWPPGKENMNI